ncbi:MAG: DUF1938 domain-containing protein [Palaeococcus sp.]|uniref:methylated-DNA--protein-cysteine methyltransferase n=1 Tax=Palaeococcus sp. (in: euryarchaeotes) TaxID=2820298 RepID=UPI0025E7A450|nr:methylated-DNA--protein-cysteine methyltransferase [Palaeococcus sp. (in: euryarchaeotes)]MCD6559151.1 DUF1938 domain-containing protein [Palaeococcus sp. (in: euryarchaeotes)]
MLTIESFEVKGRKMWIAVIHNGKIHGIIFSLDGRDFLDERLKNLTSFLIKRDVTIDLKEGESEFPEIIFRTIIGEMNNKEAFKLLSLRGLTPFERKVYEVLTKKVKRGEVISYKGLADIVKTSPRAIGGAMKRNPYPIVVPCHRVVSSNGIGYYTPKIEYKKFLLEIEGVEKWTS